MASPTSSQLRLMSDLKAIKNEPPEGCSASPLSDDNLFVWSATIFGPDETPWEGGVFGLRLTFGDNYPAKPPRVRFTSEIFHPNGTSWVQDGYVYLQRAIIYNPPVAKPPLCLKVHWICVCIVCYSLDKYVYTDGTLCIDIIQDAWSPCHNVCTILSSIQSLLTDPNPASPANPEAAQLFQHDIQAYNKRVRRCARRSIES